MKYNKFLSIIALVFLSLLLVGCSKFNSIKKGFEKAGYEYHEISHKDIDALMEEFEDNDIFVIPHLFTKGFNYPVVLEFETTKEMNEQIENSETLKGFLKDLQKSDYVRGNCILIPLGINQEEMVNAFQGK